MTLTPCPAPGCDTSGPRGGWCTRHKPLHPGDPVKVAIAPGIVHDAHVMTVTRNGHILVRMADGLGGLTVDRDQIEADLS